MGCAFVVRPGQERRGLADTLTLFPRQSTRFDDVAPTLGQRHWADAFRPRSEDETGSREGLRPYPSFGQIGEDSRIEGSQPMSGELVLEATGLRKRFGDNQAVNGVDISVGPGETFGLLGPNGAGKTTSISMIAGLLAADSGSVMVAGRPINTRSTDAKAAIGLVPQDLAIYPDLSARENLTFFGRLYGMKGPSLAKRIAEVLEVIGLADRANDRTKEFSGGMKRRLNIGIGLLHQPTLLILDEPTVGVDPQSRNAILESVEQLSRAGMAVLYTTHYMEEAERLCDRVAIIDQGVVKAEGTRRQLVELVGEADRIHITATGDLQAARAAAASVSGVLEATVADHSIEVMAGMASSLLPEVLARVAAGGAAITSVAVIEPNLEAVFLHLTGKALRD
jgi:ABC-2 type transport system ATP-binding protein